MPLDNNVKLKSMAEDRALAQAITTIASGNTDARAALIQVFKISILTSDPFVGCFMIPRVA
jgi:hypothetical protein